MVGRCRDSGMVGRWPDSGMTGWMLPEGREGAYRLAMGNDPGMWTIDSRVSGYVDHLDAALVDGFLAGYERRTLEAVAAELKLPSERFDHIHRGYFVALAVTAWEDGVVTFEEQALLTMVAAALGIPFDQALELAVTARDIEPPLLVSRLGLTARDRIAFADPLGCAIDQWHVRVRAVGLTATDDTGGARYVVTGDPNHGELNALWSAGAMVIAEWAFESGLAELEEQ